MSEGDASPTPSVCGDVDLRERALLERELRVLQKEEELLERELNAARNQRGETTSTTPRVSNENNFRPKDVVDLIPELDPGRNNSPPVSIWLAKIEKVRETYN